MIPVTRKALSMTGSLLLLLLLAFSATPSGAQQAVKIGVFDAERASQETQAGQQLYSDLERQGLDMQTELQGLQDELTKLQEEYQAGSLSMSEERRREMEREIERKQIELQTKQQTFLRQRQTDVERAQAEWTEKIRQAVEVIGREGGYDLILPAELVPYYSQSVDLTDELIDRVGRATAPAAPAAGSGG
jgi:Skp family chaperone for outer membrane proteins